ncbi:MAG: sigma-54 interaction domain-containing protein [Bdellovibrionia bacterium]
MSTREILGSSLPVKQMLDMIKRVSPSKTNVLIIGESGTGKELVARMIHDYGPLKGKPFIPVNCGAIPETLIESEMFGHRRGSFTGAVAEKAGLFEAAHGGTLFLDEVGELPLSMQVKLLRAIQERVFRKVGGTEDIRVDVRIIAATNRDLEAAVAKGTFREDLYYRLNVLLIKTPPLRERPGDVRLLAQKFAEKFAAKQKKDVKGISEQAMLALESYSWPGNVRELENVLERSVTLENGEQIGFESLPSAVRSNASLSRPSRNDDQATSPGSQVAQVLEVPAPDFSKGKVSLKDIIAPVEQAYARAALEKTGGKKKEAAALLGVTQKQLSQIVNDKG